VVNPPQGNAESMLIGTLTILPPADLSPPTISPPADITAFAGADGLGRMPSALPATAADLVVLLGRFGGPNGSNDAPERRPQHNGPGNTRLPGPFSLSFNPSARGTHHGTASSLMICCRRSWMRATASALGNTKSETFRAAATLNA